MKNISISTFIHIIFAVSFALLLLALTLFVRLDKQRFEAEQKNRYELIANSFLSGLKFFPTQAHLNELYAKFEVKPLIDRKLKLEIIKNAKVMLQKEYFRGRVRVFTLNEENYLYIQDIGYHIMVKDLKQKPYSLEIAIAVFTLLILTFLFLYLSILKKLKPLNSLNSQINEFKEGNLNVKIRYDGKDEIAQIAQSFDGAINNINRLISSKNLFMRNMMHELKTPIAKGMISLGMIEDSKDKQILERAFVRMNEIISNLAQIEKFTSKDLSLHIEKTAFSDILNYSLELAMCDGSRIKKDFKEFDISVDKTLFAIVLKNLIDNGIKFNTKEKITVKADEKSISIKSSGKKLEKPLEYYTEAFSQEEKRDSGLGLGLYIVKTILDLHGMKLEYKYQEEENSFIISF